MITITNKILFYLIFFSESAASIFGEQRRLEPMPVERKERWRKEIDLLLSVTDYMVEMVPSQHKINDGSSMEVINPLTLSNTCYICFSIKI